MPVYYILIYLKKQDEKYYFLSDNLIYFLHPFIKEIMISVKLTLHTGGIYK